MIKLVCNIENERSVVLTFRGRVVLKNKSVLEIRDEEINHPEITFLIKRKVLVFADENKKIEPKDIREKTVFKSTLPPNKLLAFDSIKGSVWGGQSIEIKTLDLFNTDVDDSIKKGYIVEVLRKEANEADKKNVVEEVKKEIKVVPEEVEEEKIEVKKVEEVEEKKNNLENINIKDVKESTEEKKAQPSFRVNDNVKSILDSIGKEVYEENQPRKSKKAKSKKEKINE